MNIKKEQIVTPWQVSGEIDYEKLISQFGTTKLTEKLKKDLENKTKSKKLHLFFRRNFIYSHRDFNKIVENIENNNFYIYTGRGPSGKMHIGHLISFITAKWFQDEFGCNVYIMLSDDEKYLISKKLNLEEINKISIQNFEEIAAIGFDPDKTFFFKNTEYISKMYKTALKFAKRTNLSTAKAIFGFNNETNLGHIFYTMIQIVPTTFERDKYCLIPAGIDQDPYWRIQRDISEKLNFKKVTAIHNKLLSPIQGINGKMSSSNENSAIFLDDDEKTIKNKINKYAFSGGKPTLEEHRKYGGIPEIDVCYNWLNILFEEEDNKINEIYKNYKTGKLTSGELKKILIEKIILFIKKHKENKEKNKKDLNKYMYSGKLAKQMWEK
ncbi:MAG: tryptophan--tRNA ligase [Candidatus ainarchaeum sp.]|nr:tryptophan--tRNA ligase [Candidatus ainarchaeum sp.]MDD3975800.1 tryptophan--tRNA ligase [Candidatus ainarchaeum sp.]